MAVTGINVPIGAAKVEFDTGVNMATFDITKGGINLAVSTATQDVTVDQFGDTPVKSILKGRSVEVTVPFAINDLERLAKVMPNSTLLKAGTGNKIKLTVNAQAGFDLLGAAKKLVIKPTDPSATANDWVTIPLASATADPQYTYDADNERICNITFKGFPDITTGVLYILGDETAV